MTKPPQITDVQAYWQGRDLPEPPARTTDCQWGRFVRHVRSGESIEDIAASGGIKARSLKPRIDEIHRRLLWNIERREFWEIYGRPKLPELR